MDIWTDASFDQKRKVAGIGIVIKKGMKQRSYSLWIRADNVNIAEIFAIHLACVLAGGEKSTIHTDSQTAISYINKQIRDDKPRTKEQYINHNRMKFWAYKIRKFNMNIEKVKAHQKNMQLPSLFNHESDINAKKGLGKYYLTLPKDKLR